MDAHLPSMFVAVLVLLVLGVSRVVEASECFNTPCTPNGATCFTSGCERIGLQTVCQLSSTSNEYPAIKEAACVQPVLVPGFVDFCMRLLENANIGAAPAPKNIQNDIVTVSSTSTNCPSSDENVQELEPGEMCYGSTILASVGIGCFISGCAVTLFILGCCRFWQPCSGKAMGGASSFGSDTTDVWHTRLRSRELGSTSTAQLLDDSCQDIMVAHNSLNRASEDICQPLQQRPPEPLPRFTRSGFQLGSRSHIDTDPVAMDTVYTAASESSSRDYQSIHTGSENPYVVNSESGSDYSVGVQRHQILPPHDHMPHTVGTIGSNPGGYNSLNGHKLCKDIAETYNPACDDMYKDYTSLDGEREGNSYHDITSVSHGSLVHDPSHVMQTVSGNSQNVQFRVNGLNNIPSGHYACTKVREVGGMNEYEQLRDRSGQTQNKGHNYRDNSDNIKGSNSDGVSLSANLAKETAQPITYADNWNRSNHFNDTIADMSVKEEAVKALDKPHEYFILEPLK